MLLKASLKNGNWNLVKEIMRFISSIDPADFENTNGDVFDFNEPKQFTQQQQQSPTPAPFSPNNHHTPYKLNKTTPNTSRNSISSPPPKKTPGTDPPVSGITPKTVNNSSSSVASTSGRHRLCLSEIELSRKSIESTIHEYALELLKAYRVRRLFEMFSQLGFLNILKWLEQYQSVSLIENFVQAVSSVHFEFNWPYPIMINEFKKSKIDQKIRD